MSVSNVQQWSGNNTAGTNVQSLTNVPAAGNLLVWYAEVDNGTATLSFSDNMTDGGTWQHVTGSPLTFAAGPAKGYLLWKVVGAAANTGKQRTAAVSAGTPNVESWCVEVGAGAGHTWSVDAVTAATGSSNTPNSANALTLTSALNFIVGTIASDRARTAVAPCTSRVATAAYFYSGVEDAYNQSTSITPQWTVGVSTAWMCFGAAFKATPAPQITGGTAAPVHQSTGNTVTGANFGASQTGSAALAIGSTGQTETAWGDTSITYTADRGINGNGIAVNAVVTDSGGLVSAAYALTGFQPPAGWTSVTLVSVEADPAMRLQSSADLAIGNQIEWDDPTIEITDSGVPVWPPGTSDGYTFNFRVWVSGSGWGATEVATLNPASASSGTAGRRLAIGLGIGI